MTAIAAADHLVRLTRVDAALPFWVAAVIVVIGALLSDFVTDKVESVLRAWMKESGQSESRLPDFLHPEYIAKMSSWTIDTAQVVTTILAPLVGILLLFHQGATGALVLANLGIVLLSLAAFRHFWRSRPDHYGVGWPWILTPLTAVALVLNLAGSGIAYWIGP